MNGTFNGLPLRRIIAVKTSEDAPGFTRTTFRVLGGANRKLEERLHLGDDATLILSSSVDGWIIAFEGDLYRGYEITIELQKSAGAQVANCAVPQKILRPESFQKTNL